MVVAMLGEFSVARLISACRWSWILAAVFIVVASVQWWLIGVGLDSGFRRREPQQAGA
jgi:hypothetical protein